MLPAARYMVGPEIEKTQKKGRTIFFILLVSS
jgi:hypothetical protein